MNAITTIPLPRMAEVEELSQNINDSIVKLANIFSTEPDPAIRREYELTYYTNTPAFTELIGTILKQHNITISGFKL